jgi:tetratricopeptide (TPR) repeat protein
MRSTISLLAAAVLLPALVGCSAPERKPTGFAQLPLKDANLLLARGKAYSELGDFTRAEQYFEAALAAGGKSSVIIPQLIKACVASGDLRLASDYAETELSRHPNDAHLRFLTGALYASTGNRSIARDHLVQAANELPNDADVQFSVAAFFRDDLNDRVGSDPYFREYLRISPKGDRAEEARASLMERIR